MNKLYIDSITKSYGTRRILTDVAISIQQGEIVALFGRNGSGKSTLMKIIYGCENAPTKYIRFNDDVITNRNKYEYITYLPQQSCLPQNLKLTSIFNSWKKQADIVSLSTFEKIKELKSRRIKELSWGEKRYLEIALFCHSNNPFIFLDEPFNGLSPILIEDIQKIIKKRSAKKGFLISDHNYANVLEISNKVILLNNGHTKEITETNQLQELGYLP